MDAFWVHKLDRLSWSQVEVTNRLSDRQPMGCYVRILDGMINTRVLGKSEPLVIGLLTGLAGVERSLIEERIK